VSRIRPWMTQHTTHSNNNDMLKQEEQLLVLELIMLSIKAIRPPTAFYFFATTAIASSLGEMTASVPPVLNRHRNMMYLNSAYQVIMCQKTVFVAKICNLRASDHGTLTRQSLFGLPFVCSVQSISSPTWQ
jgi:hypothetical protein